MKLIAPLALTVTRLGRIIFPHYTAPNKTLNQRLAMASSQVVIMTAMAVLLAVVSAAHAADAPAPSPSSPASVISPSFAVGFLTAAVALVFGSSLRI